jgi:N-acetylglucosaminyl-diphospho-decaprenol L-rhamnosyltransferase
MSRISVSIVSHGQGGLLPPLLADLAACPEVSQVIVTRNIAEPSTSLQPAHVLAIDNATPKGFAANHNAAFEHATAPYFAVLNPDLRLAGNPFPTLLKALDDPGTCIVAPAVVNPRGELEDSARRFPTLSHLVGKAFGADRTRVQYELGAAPLPVPWVGGMFLLAHTEDFRCLGGFDANFFLYYEDVDLCVRVWRAGKRVMLCPAAQVVHDARRASRRRLRYMAWHASSMARYFLKHGGRLPRAAPR